MLISRYAKWIAGLLLLCFSLCTYAATMTSLFRDQNDPTAGDKNGKVTVVEFFDYRCSHCINTAPAVNAVIKANPHVRFVFKEFPVFGPASELGAKAALAANMQGKYYEFHEALITTDQPINNALITRIAATLELDAKKLKADMTSKTVLNEINNVHKIAREIKLQGTPAFFIGKTDSPNLDKVTFILGEASEKQLNNAIKKASNP